MISPECQRVTTYGRAADALRKTDEELKELKDHGLTMVYIGAESGSDKVLQKVNKGETRQQLIDAVHRLEAAGIKTSVTFISGLAGPEMWEEHAIETGTMIAEMNASYVSLLTLMLQPPAPLLEDYREGRFKLLTPEEVLAETCLMLPVCQTGQIVCFQEQPCVQLCIAPGQLAGGQREDDRLPQTLHGRPRNAQRRKVQDAVGLA